MLASSMIDHRINEDLFLYIKTLKLTFVRNSNLSFNSLSWLESPLSLTSRSLEGQEGSGVLGLPAKS